jgi:hypothetical protein
MAGIVGLGTTYNLPNYVGEVFQITPSDTPFLSAIGGLTGGKLTKSTEFSWQTFDLEDASQPEIVEGAEPTGKARIRAEVSNVVQIFQEAVQLSYSKLAASQKIDNVAAVGGANPITNELDWQVEQALKKIARDIEYSFIRGVYNKPTNNTQARKTRGILSAITTNVVDASGAHLSEKMLLDLLQQVWDNGGIREQATATVFVNSFQKRKLSEIFGYAPEDRNVGGVNVQVIETDFGRLNVMLNRYVPSDTLLVVSLEVCAPVFLEVPGKGFLFQEPLAQTGSSVKYQIYGECGLEYGWEGQHGKIINLATS